MRAHTALTLLLLALPYLSGRSAAAQTRLAVGAVGTWQSGSSLYHHEYRETDASTGSTFYHEEGLRLARLPLVGLRMERAVIGPWALYAEGAHGATTYEFRESSGGSNSQGGTSAEERINRGDAAVTSLSLGVFRPIGSTRLASVLEVSAGVTADRTRIEKDECTPLPPSTGFPGCGDAGAFERVETTYTVPGLTAGVNVRQRVNRRLELLGRGRYAYGRVDTRSMRVDLVSSADHLEAPTSHGRGVAHLSVAAMFRF